MTRVKSGCGIGLPVEYLFVSGPSVERTEELQALVELGLVTILGPEMRVEMKAVNLLLMLICFRKIGIIVTFN